MYYDGQQDTHPFSDCALPVECFVCCCRICGHYMLMVAFVFQYLRNMQSLGLLHNWEFYFVILGRYLLGEMRAEDPRLKTLTHMLSVVKTEIHNKIKQPHNLRIKQTIE